jgi:protein disulfide-isomerase-like protein
MLKVKTLQTMLNPKNLPKVLFLLAVLLILYFIYTRYLKEGFEVEPDDLDNEIKTGKKLVLFYADWCGHCKKLKPAWDETAKEFNSDKNNPKMLKVNCGDDNNESKKLMKKYDINGYPTILLFVNGRPMPYDGERTEEGFLNALNVKDS